MNEKRSKPYFSLKSRLILTVYLLAFITSFFCAAQSIRAARSRMLEAACDSALNEQFRIGYAIKKTAESHNYTKNEEMLYLLGAVRNSALSYSQYYGTKACFSVAAVMEDGSVELIYSSIPVELETEASPKTDGTVSYFITESGGGTFVFAASYIKIYQSLFRLDYVQDITEVIASVKDLSNRIALTLFTADALLFISLALTIGNALKPLTGLQRQASAIAGGDYEKRAEIVHNDEVGYLAESINDMSDAVEKHVKALSETARLKELFSANLAHEIKTPLTAIVAYSDYALKKDLDKETLCEILEHIKKEGRRMSSLSDKILKWSDINSRKDIDIKPCRPERITEIALNTLRPAAAERNQSIKAETRVSVIYADEPLIISLIINLCKNALNASNNGGTVYLSLENGGDGFLVIKVRDTGIGIEKEELEKITEPFYMVDKSRDRAKGGAGLGLSLCLAIAEAHNARMEIDSKFGKGTLVTVTIPQPG